MFLRARALSLSLLQRSILSISHISIYLFFCFAYTSYEWYHTGARWVSICTHSEPAAPFSCHLCTAAPHERTAEREQRSYLALNESSGNCEHGSGLFPHTGLGTQRDGSNHSSLYWSWNVGEAGVLVGHLLGCYVLTAVPTVSGVTLIAGIFLTLSLSLGAHAFTQPPRCQYQLEREGSSSYLHVQSPFEQTCAMHISPFTVHHVRPSLLLSGTQVAVIPPTTYHHHRHHHCCKNSLPMWLACLLYLLLLGMNLNSTTPFLLACHLDKRHCF